MSYTMEDFKRDLIKDQFKKLSREERQEIFKKLSRGERQEVLRSVPPEERLAGLSPEQIRQYLDRLNAGRRVPPRKAGRKN
jgi:hypothetical protein